MQQSEHYFFKNSPILALAGSRKLALARYRESLSPSRAAQWKITSYHSVMESYAAKAEALISSTPWQATMLGALKMPSVSSKGW